MVTEDKIDLFLAIEQVCCFKKRIVCTIQVTKVGVADMRRKSNSQTPIAVIDPVVLDHDTDLQIFLLQ